MFIKEKKKSLINKWDHFVRLKLPPAVHKTESGFKSECLNVN